MNPSPERSQHTEWWPHMHLCFAVLHHLLLLLLLLKISSASTATSACHSYGIARHFTNCEYDWMDGWMMHHQYIASPCLLLFLLLLLLPPPTSETHMYGSTSTPSETITPTITPSLPPSQLFPPGCCNERSGHRLPAS